MKIYFFEPFPQLMYKLKVNNKMLTITIPDPRIKFHDNQKQNLAKQYLYGISSKHSSGFRKITTFLQPCQYNVTQNSRHYNKSNQNCKNNHYHYQCICIQYYHFYFKGKALSVTNDPFLLSGGPNWGEDDFCLSEAGQGLLLPGQHQGVGAELFGQGGSSQSKGIMIKLLGTDF